MKVQFDTAHLNSPQEVLLTYIPHPLPEWRFKKTVFNVLTTSKQHVVATGRWWRQT